MPESTKANYKPYQLLINNVWIDSRALELCPQVLENFLRIDKEDSEQPKIDTSDVFTFPEPGLLYGARNISRKQYLEKLQKYSQVPLKCGVGEMEF